MTLPLDLQKHAEKLRQIRRNRVHVTSEEAKKQTDRVTQRQVHPIKYSEIPIYRREYEIWF